MGLGDIEHILARLSADEALRARFVENPFALGRELGLSAASTRQLRREAAERFDSFAATPRERRFVQVNKLLPLTHRVLRGRFNMYFDRYVAEHGEVAIEHLFADVLRFAEYLEQQLRDDYLGSGWTLDLLRFEKARVKAADPNRRFVVAYFRHDISRLVRGVARKDQAPLLEVVVRRSVALWWRPRPHAPVRYSVIAAPRLFRRGS
ncbi:MAG TPA: hypothetical protein VGX48_26435 [Pyrinomonadaceae bacterium]|jgi:hypothetical protein|nr:hypothetical protein [Pyrinomonadaceae bacterium]